MAIERERPYTQFNFLVDLATAPPMAQERASRR